MTTPRSLGDFCRYILDNGEARYASDPVRLGAIFREYAGIKSTPTLLRTIRHGALSWHKDRSRRLFKVRRHEYDSQWPLAYPLFR